MAVNKSKRNYLLGLIHIGKAQLGMSEDDYRAMLGASPFRVQSAADLDLWQMSRLIDRMKELGLSLRSAGANKRPGPPGGSRQSEGSRMNAGAACRPCRPRPSHAVERPSDEVRWPVTTTQEQDIAQLRQNIHWGAPGGYLRWLMKYHKVLDVQDSRTAGRVIAGLRGLCMSQHHCRLCGEAGCISRLTSSPEGPRGPHVPESTLRYGDPSAPRHASKSPSASAESKPTSQGEKPCQR